MDDEWLWDGPRAGTGRAIKKSVLMDALLNCDGIPLRAAKALGCHEYTIYRHIKSDPDLKAIVDASYESIIDKSQYVLSKGIDELDVDKKHALECVKVALKYGAKAMKSRGMSVSDEDKTESETTIVIKRSTDASDAAPELTNGTD
jgi:hypothetical protein